MDIPDELPQWQKDILEERKALVSQSEELISIEDFIKLLEGDEEG